MRRRPLLGVLALAACSAACGLDVVGTFVGRDAGPGDAGTPVSLPPGPADAAVEDDASVGDDAGDASVPLDASDDADAGLAPSTVLTTSVSATTLTVDRARPQDGPVGTDGQKDGVFQATVTGPATAIALIRTDLNGVPMSSQEWDTWVEDDVIPAALAAGFTKGQQTFTLAVLEGATLKNDSKGRVTLAAGVHTLTLAGSDVGSFVSGSHFRVVLEAPGGALVRGPVVTY